MNPIQKQINDLEADLAVAQKRLEELRVMAAAAAPEPAKPWEPKGGKFYLHPNGDVHAGPSMSRDRLAGSEYPTREAAESAAPYVTFFKRLCCLAAELNPSGKVGGTWRIVTWDGQWDRRCTRDSHSHLRDVWDLFETEEAAQKAAEIATRDGWKVPSL